MSTAMKTITVEPQQGPNGKWSACFENWRHFDSHSERYMASEVVSAAVFDTKDAALEGGHRALQQLERTGQYPNMCEPW